MLEIKKGTEIQGRYVVGDHLGSGGFGIVWRATDKQLHRDVAIKRLTSQAGQDEHLVEEARRTVKLGGHQNIVQVFDVIQVDGEALLVMEFVDGESLEALCRRHIRSRTWLDQQDALDIWRQVLEGLVFAHKQQLYHRDIKPSNIVFVEGRPKFADIGLVTNIATPDHRVTRIGTEGFMAPEGPGTPAGDVYSLGKVLYEASMGRDCGQFPEFPTTLGVRPDQGDLRQLHDVILTACEADPQDRYPTATAMHEALEALWEEPAR